MHGIALVQGQAVCPDEVAITALHQQHKLAGELPWLTQGRHDGDMAPANNTQEWGPPLEMAEDATGPPEAERDAQDSKI